MDGKPVWWLIKRVRAGWPSRLRARNKCQRQRTSISSGVGQPAIAAKPPIHRSTEPTRSDPSHMATIWSGPTSSWWPEKEKRPRPRPTRWDEGSDGKTGWEVAKCVLAIAELLLLLLLWLWLWLVKKLQLGSRPHFKLANRCDTNRVHVWCCNARRWYVDLHSTWLREKYK